jgi:protein-S-isoprenylcysteine O-methyltransferase Ste14
VRAMEPHTRYTPGGLILKLTRLWLPLAIAVAGVVLIVIGHGRYSDLANSRSLESAAGVALLLVALIVWMVNWMFRLSVRSNLDRDDEEAARVYFDRTGRWPDEEPEDPSFEP